MKYLNSTLDIVFVNIRAYPYLSALLFVVLFWWLFGVKAILTTVAAAALFLIWVLGVTGDGLGDDDDWFGSGPRPA